MRAAPGRRCLNDYMSDPQGPSFPQVSIGDIGVSETSVFLSSGTYPIAGTTWQIADYSRTETKIPTWAIVCAIIFAFACLLGLLFLMVKERTTTGYVQVTVSGPDFAHTATIRAQSEQTAIVVTQQVNWARGLASQQS